MLVDREAAAAVKKGVFLACKALWGAYERGKENPFPPAYLCDFRHDKVCIYNISVCNCHLSG